MNGELIIRHAEPVMGTVVSFDVRPRGLARVATQAALREACAVLHRADGLFSLYREATPMSRLRGGEVAVSACPPEVAEVLLLCELAREQSDGWFDPWALPGGVDPTGLVKGWAAREAARVLARAGVAAAMVNAAGDIATFGSPTPGRPWRLGVRSPSAADELLCIVEPAGAVATSGGYERGDHIHDVRRGRPARGAVSATVCGADLALADAFATALVASREAGLPAVERAGYTALLVLPDGAVVHHDGFPFAVGQSVLAVPEPAGA